MIPEVEGLSPMEASDLAHENRPTSRSGLQCGAQSDGKNVLWDITMSSRASTERRIDELRSSSYTYIDAIFVDIPIETSISRADARHREGYDDWRIGRGSVVVPSRLRSFAHRMIPTGAASIGRSSKRSSLDSIHGRATTIR